MNEVRNSQSIIEAVAIVAREAGKALVSRRMDFAVSEKTKGEIVTPADVEANRIIVEGLQKHFPEYSFSSEEEGEQGDQSKSRFIIDPMDGTTRKVWGGSGYTVAIAEEVGGNIRCAVVYDPEHDEMFTAIAGKGAFRNGTSIRVAELTELSEGFVACDWGNKDGRRGEGLEYYGKLMLPQMAARRIVPQFAPANDLVRIAEGRIHALVCNDTWLEDHSAAALILQEAGGYVTNFYNREGFDHKTPGIIAANNKAVWEMLVARIF